MQPNDAEAILITAMALGMEGGDNKETMTEVAIIVSFCHVAASSYPFGQASVYECLKISLDGEFGTKRHPNGSKLLRELVSRVDQQVGEAKKLLEG